METKAPSEIKSITLCMSGGGYRSMAFQLGTLFYLDRVGLRENVNLISTVSGGTFTGASYALALTQNAGFAQYFAILKKQMRTVNLLQEGLNKLSNNVPQKAGKSNNLINAMALVYDHEYFGIDYRNGNKIGGQKFSVLQKNPSHLENIIFNGTEFFRGLTFRFLLSRNTNTYAGNYYLHIPPSPLGEIPIADMVASSSCFPGGFEPMKFPQDYLPGDQYEKERKAIVEAQQAQNGETAEEVEQRKEALRKGVGVMDGGIDDNQGIGSARLVHDRGKAFPDMFIISDVGSKFMDPFVFPPKNKLSGFKRLTLQWLDILLVTLCVIMGLTILASVSAVFAHWFMPSVPSVLNSWSDYLTYIMAPVIIAINLYLLLKLRGVVRNDVLANIPVLGERSWSYFRKIAVGTFADMIALRIASVMTMVSDVFLKQIRRLLFNELYNTNRYENMLVSNLIYGLTKESVEARARDQRYNFLPPSMKTPSLAVMEMAQSAADMGTTLWFEEEELKHPHTPKNKLDSLIACGQVTICFNLLLFILRNYGTKPDSYPPAIKKIYDQAMSDWANFQNSPYTFAGES